MIIAVEVSTTGLSRQQVEAALMGMQFRVYRDLTVDAAKWTETGRVYAEDEFEELEEKECRQAFGEHHMFILEELKKINPEVRLETYWSIKSRWDFTHSFTDDVSEALGIKKKVTPVKLKFEDLEFLQPEEIHVPDSESYDYVYYGSLSHTDT